MDDAYLIYFAAVLLLGTLVTALANRLNISNTFFLIFSGMLLGATGLISFPNDAILIISSLTLILVVFDSTDRLKFKEIERFSSYSMKIVVVFFLVNLAVMSISTFLLLRLPTDYTTVVLVIAFSCLMYGLDHETNLQVLKKRPNKSLKILVVESLLNRPLTLIAPLILLNYLAHMNAPGASVGGEIFLFFRQFIVGAVVGVASGAIMLVVLNSIEKEDLSSLVVITTCILTYVVAQVLGADGAIALTGLALMFGNFHVKHKNALEKFTSTFSNIFNIFVFILIGTSLLLRFDYILEGTALFGVYLLGRFLAVIIALWDSKIPLKEKVFMGLHVPKGIDVAIIILIMVSQFGSVPGISTIINLSLLFCLYSLILSNTLPLMADQFLGKVHPEEAKNVAEK